MPIIMDEVRAVARAAIEREQFQLAVAAEKARQLAPKKSLWQRLTQWLPFTITWKKTS